jgi:hypothetical protein
MKFILRTSIISASILLACSCKPRSENALPARDNDSPIGKVTATLRIDQLNDSGFVFRLRINTDTSKVIYFITPDPEMGGVSFFSRTGDREDYGHSPIITTQGGFSGWKGGPSDEFEMLIHAKFSADGKLVVQESEQVIRFLNSPMEIAANVLIRASNFQEERCRQFQIKTNFVSIDLPDSFPRTNKDDSTDDSLPDSKPSNTETLPPL